MGQYSRYAAGILCAVFAMATLPQAEAADAKPKPKPAATAAKKQPAPKPKPKPKPKPAAPAILQSSVILNGETGQILACDQCNEPRAPASLTKLMTAMVGFDALQAKKISLHDMVALSPALSAQSQGAVTLAGKGVKAGTMISMDSVFSAIAVTSAADATLTLSKAICGDDDCIVTLMNDKAKAILNDPKAKTRFSNPHGMPGKTQITTAYEMAVIMQYMMKTYPQQYWRYFGQTSYTVNGIHLRGHNKSLIDYKCNNAVGLPYACMEAGKTGFFRYPGKDQGPAAGFSIAGSAAWNGYRVIAVRMGDASAGIRNERLHRLFDQGFEALKASKAPQTVRMPLHFPNLFPDKVEPEDEQSHIRALPEAKLNGPSRSAPAP